MAFNRGYAPTIQVLLSAGMAPDALIDGRTPLFRAAERGIYEMVKVLANAGASLDFKGAARWNRLDGGYTPYAIAKKRGQSLQILGAVQERPRSRTRGSSTNINMIEPTHPVLIWSSCIDQHSRLLGKGLCNLGERHEYRGKAR